MTIASQIHDVVRQVASTGDEHRIILEQTFSTTPDDLWSACTDPERVRRWFEPVEGDLRLGGRYTLTDSGTRGTIETCDAPRRLRVTWEYEDDVSHVEVTIAPTDSGATLTLEHVVPDNDHWARFGPGAAGAGWDESFLPLALHLAGDDRSEPAAMAAWSTTHEGRDFLGASLAAWRDAQIASGAAPDLAEAASRRTAEAYA